MGELPVEDGDMSSQCKGDSLVQRPRTTSICSTASDIQGAKRPRGRPPLSAKTAKGPARSRINSFSSTDERAANGIDCPEIPVRVAAAPTTPTQTLPSKAKVGAILRGATKKLISRLMTEEPIPLSSLQDTVKDITFEQIQDILDVLQVMGLVVSVRPRRKRARSVGSMEPKVVGCHTVAISGDGCDGNALPEPVDASNISSESISSNSVSISILSPSRAAINFGSGATNGAKASVRSTENEVWYTMTGYARGPEPPEDMWSIYSDILQRKENARAAKQRLEELEVK